MKSALVCWKQSDARTAIKQSRSVFRSAEFDIRIAAKTAKVARVLVVAPKKSGNAVKRNRFRRRIKALFRERNLHSGGFDWIIFAKSNLSSLSFAQLESIFTTIESILQKNY